MKNSKKAIGLGILTNYLQYILNILLGIVLSPLVLKFAGQETMGAYAILLQVISYVSLIDLGVGLSASRFLSQSYALGLEDFVNTSNIYRSVAILQNTLMAVLFIILSVFIEQIFHFSHHLAGEVRIGLWLLALWTFLSSPWSLYTGILYTTNNMSTQNMIDAASNLVKIVLAVVFVMLGWSIIGLIVSQIISQLFALVIKWYVTKKKVGEIGFKFSLALNDKFRTILAFSFNSFLITIAIRLVFSTDNLVIGYLYGPVAVTVYYLTFQPGNMLNQFILRITDNFTPSVNIWFANGETERLKTSFLLLFRITYVLTVLMLWGIVFCTQPIIYLWVGKANYLAQPMSLWCGLFAASVVLGHVPNAFVIANGQIKVLSYIALFEGVFNLTLSLTLSRFWGVQAIMLATFIANVPTALYLYFKAVKVLDCKHEFLKEILQWRYIISVMIIPILWITMGRLIDGNANFYNNILLAYTLKVVVSFPVAMAFMYSKILTAEERVKVTGMMPFKKASVFNKQL